MDKTITVLVADDQEVVRKGLVTLLSLQPDITVVGEAAHGGEACKMAEELEPDIILMDIRMPQCDGIAATLAIRKQNPEIKILVLTTFDEEDLVIQSLQAGASGYLLKNAPSEQISKAIRAVYDGILYLGPTPANKLLQQVKGKRSTPTHTKLDTLLSERELQILKLIGEGRNNKEICTSLGLTEGTVRNYVSRIFTQINARDRIQAALIAQQELL